MIDKQFEDVLEDERQRKEKAPTVGRVTKVYDKTDDELETGNIELNVITRSRTNEYRRIAFIGFDHPGHTYVPQVGEHVLLQFRAGRGLEPIATDIVYTEEQRAPNARAGHWRHEFESADGSIFLEAEPDDGEAGDPNVIRIAHKPDGLEEATTEISLDISDGSASVRIDVGDGDQGFELDEKTGRTTWLDGEGYGIQSDGSGHFTWRHEEIDFIEGETIPFPE